jgi:hypothetical protein
MSILMIIVGRTGSGLLAGLTYLGPFGMPAAQGIGYPDFVRRRVRQTELLGLLAGCLT